MRRAGFDGDRELKGDEGLDGLITSKKGASLGERDDCRRGEDDAGKIGAD